VDDFSVIAESAQDRHEPSIGNPGIARKSPGAPIMAGTRAERRCEASAVVVAMRIPCQAIPDFRGLSPSHSRSPGGRKLGLNIRRSGRVYSLIT
jgi:hypothetical protein